MSAFLTSLAEKERQDLHSSRRKETLRLSISMYVNYESTNLAISDHFSNYSPEILPIYIPPSFVFFSFNFLDSKFLVDGLYRSLHREHWKPHFENSGGTEEWRVSFRFFGIGVLTLLLQKKMSSKTFLFRNS